MIEIVPSLPMKRVEDWKSRLIDLSRKNNLLYFHKAKRGNLSITHPDPQKIFDILVLKKNRLEFWSPSEEPKKSEPTDKTEAKLAKPEFKAATGEGPKRPLANQLVCGNLSRINLKLKLKGLERHSLLDYRERGVRILHLAFGTLNWVDL